jgi:iron-sulfur cluster assembly protein
MTIILTEKAATHIKKFISKRGSGIGIRFGVRTTGCSGLAYKLEFVDEKLDDDLVFTSRDVSIFIDPQCLPFVNGTELDFHREGLNEGFKFKNPNAKDACGCGESFRV